MKGRDFDRPMSFDLPLPSHCRRSLVLGQGLINCFPQLCTWLLRLKRRLCWATNFIYCLISLTAELPFFSMPSGRQKYQVKHSLCILCFREIVGICWIHWMYDQTICDPRVKLENTSCLVQKRSFNNCHKKGKSNTMGMWWGWTEHFFLVSKEIRVKIMEHWSSHS